MDIYNDLWYGMIYNDLYEYSIIFIIFVIYSNYRVYYIVLFFWFVNIIERLTIPFHWSFDVKS